MLIATSFEAHRITYMTIRYHNLFHAVYIANSRDTAEEEEKGQSWLNFVVGWLHDISII